MRISDWSSDVCPSDLQARNHRLDGGALDSVSPFGDPWHMCLTARRKVHRELRVANAHVLEIEPEERPGRARHRDRIVLPFQQIKAGWEYDALRLLIPLPPALSLRSFEDRPREFPDFLDSHPTYPPPFPPPHL